MNEKTIAFLGDSISAGAWDHPNGGWVVRLIEKMRADYPCQIDYMNAAVAGYRTFDVLHQLCGAVLHNRPDVLVISVGVNDVQRYLRSDSHMGLSAALREELWRRALDMATKNIKRVFVTSIQPVDEARGPFIYQNEPPIYFLNQDIDVYNAQIKLICTDYRVDFLDLRSKIDIEKWPKFLYDSIHPNAEGHAFLADLAYQFLKDKI